jgi:hypothetical protein
MLMFLNAGGKEALSQRLEITKNDIFANSAWNSTQIEIMGFYLGMSSHDATLHARKLGTSLIAPEMRNYEECTHGLCELCYPQYICPGVALHFGNEDKVVGITVTRTPEYALPSVRRAAITRKLKGETYELFNNYSNNLRKKLIGIEDSREALPMWIMYKYNSRGLIMRVGATSSLPEKEFDMSIEFIPPTQR